MTQLPRFITSEDGAVSVDYVVLTAGATGMALALSAIFAYEVGFLSDNVSRGSQYKQHNYDYEQPSFAYRPANPEMHALFIEELSQMSEEDLALLSAWGNWMEPQALELFDPETAAMTLDFNNAVTKVYADRGQSRPINTDFDQADFERVTAQLMLGEPAQTM